MSFYAFSFVVNIITVCFGVTILYVAWKYINGDCDE